MNKTELFARGAICFSIAFTIANLVLYCCAPETPNLVVPVAPNIVWTGNPVFYSGNDTHFVADVQMGFLDDGTVIYRKVKP